MFPKKAFVGIASVLSLFGATVMAVNGQHKATGLTGSDRPADVVLARQSLMSSVELQMQPIDQAASTEGDIDLSALAPRADAISGMLTVFPHLFPPETMPTEGGDISTTALPLLWDDFETFYTAATNASNIAFEVSQAPDAETFRRSAAELRTSCNSCHAQFMQNSDSSAPPK